MFKIRTGRKVQKTTQVIFRLGKQLGYFFYPTGNFNFKQQIC